MSSLYLRSQNHMNSIFLLLKVRQKHQTNNGAWKTIQEDFTWRKILKIPLKLLKPEIKLTNDYLKYY